MKRNLMLLYLLVCVCLSACTGGSSDQISSSYTPLEPSVILDAQEIRTVELEVPPDGQWLRNNFQPHGDKIYMVLTNGFVGYYDLLTQSQVTHSIDLSLGWVQRVGQDGIVVSNPQQGKFSLLDFDYQVIKEVYCPPLETIANDSRHHLDLSAQVYPDFSAVVYPVQYGEPDITTLGVQKYDTASGQLSTILPGEAYYYSLDIVNEKYLVAIGASYSLIYDMFQDKITGKADYQSNLDVVGLYDQTLCMKTGLYHLPSGNQTAFSVPLQSYLLRDGKCYYFEGDQLMMMNPLTNQEPQIIGSVPNASFHTLHCATNNKLLISYQTDQRQYALVSLKA